MGTMEGGYVGGSQHGAISVVRDGGRSARTSSAKRIKTTFTQPVWLHRNAGEERVSHMLRKEVKKGGWSWGELGAGRWAEDSWVALSVSFLTVWEERTLVSRTQEAR